jgi:hypothetical protein
VRRGAKHLGVNRYAAAVACLALLALPCAPAQAWARVRPQEEACPIAHIRLNVSYSCALEFTLEGSNGYKITVSGDPGGGRDSVQLSADSHSGEAVYLTSGKVSANRIEARFGKLGAVSVQFRPSGRQRRVKVPGKCFPRRPPMVSSRLGSFVGRIEFRGEQGYTRVSASGADGGVGDPLTNTPSKISCDTRESAGERKRELESISLEAASPSPEVSFSASRLFGHRSLGDLLGEPVAADDDYLFLAASAEREGRMLIFRSTGALGGPKEFSFDDALTSATVRPPAPFTGTGSFLRNADGSTSWTGDLAASLPGLGAVDLTGGTAELSTVAKHLEQLEEKIKP